MVHPTFALCCICQMLYAESGICYIYVAAGLCYMVHPAYPNWKELLHKCWTLHMPGVALGIPKCGEYKLIAGEGQHICICCLGHLDMR